MTYWAIEGDMWIGIDPSYSGLALVALTAAKASPGVLDTMDARWAFTAAEYGTGGKRLAHIHDTLYRLLNDLRQHHAVRGIGIEGYAPGATFNREVLGELGGIVRLAIHQALGEVCPPPLIVPPMSVKKFATGRGNAPKDTVMLSVYKKWGREFTSNDLADAYTVARVVHAHECGAQLAYEKEVLASLRKKRL